LIRRARFSPEPALTAVVGRNGTGKSSFAKALEVLVTGHVRRGADRSAIWWDGWHDLRTIGESVIEAT
jgi:recombinational DNA repair ATPase RecF